MRRSEEWNARWEASSRAMPFAGRTLGWCPDSTCVLVTDSTGPGKADALFAMAIDSGEKRQVTFPPELVSDVDPSVSPDGRSLIFRRNTAPFLGSFYRVALSDGAVPPGEPVRLTPPLGGGNSTWTRDGREIVFSANRVLWRFDAMKGGTPTRLASVGQDGQSPVIAPTDDGRQRLVYLHSVGDVNVWRVTTSEPGAPASAQPVVAIASTRGDFVSRRVAGRASSGLRVEPFGGLAGLAGLGCGCRRFRCSQADVDGVPFDSVVP